MGEAQQADPILAQVKPHGVDIGCVVGQRVRGASAGAVEPPVPRGSSQTMVATSSSPARSPRKAALVPGPPGWAMSAGPRPLTR